jgi:aminoglycoside 6'-N-acetyltransferase
VVEFRRLEELDFPMLTAWLAQPQVRKFYQKTPVSLVDVALEYTASVRGEEPSHCHLALAAGTPFAYLQCYRNVDYPGWANLIGVSEGISVDLFIGDPTFLHRGFGRAALGHYLERIAFPHYPAETRAYIAHERANLAARRCSEAVGFRPVREFLEDGFENVLLELEHAPPKAGR